MDDGVCSHDNEVLSKRERHFRFGAVVVLARAVHRAMDINCTSTLGQLHFHPGSTALPP